MDYPVVIGDKTYYYNKEFKVLLYDKERRVPVRVQFFKGEVYDQYLRVKNEIDNLVTGAGGSDSA